MAVVTQAGLDCWVPIRSMTRLPAAAALATSESRNVQSKTPSVGSRLAQLWRIRTPVTSGLFKTMSLAILSGLLREKTPRGTWAKAFPGFASSPAAQSSRPGKVGILKAPVLVSLRGATCQAKSRNLIIINKVMRSYSPPRQDFFFRNLLRLENEIP